MSRAERDALGIARAIAYDLAASRERGDAPLAIIVGPDLALAFRRERGLARPELFGLPMRVDSRVDGWAIRVKDGP